MNPIVLTTNNAGTNDPSVLVLGLPENMTLDNNFVTLANCTVTYNWRNFKASQYNNTKFSYKHIPSNKTVEATIPDGSYSIEDLNNYVHFVMKNNNHVNAQNAYDINLYANPTYRRVTIAVGSDFELTLKDGLLTTLGFDQSQMPLTNSETNGNNIPIIEPVTTVQIHSNLVYNQFDNSSLLYAFTPDQSPGAILHIKPPWPIWHSTRNSTQIREIEVRFTDQDSFPLDIVDSIRVELIIADSNFVRNYQI